MSWTPSFIRTAAVVVLVCLVAPVARAPAAARGGVTCSESRTSGASSTRPFDVGDARPDDSLDDYPAIQTAIDRAGAAGGGVVGLAAGTYLIDGHLRLATNVTLRGVGPATVLKAGPLFLDTTGPHGGQPLITTDGADDVTIAALTADQSGDTLDAADITGRLAEYLVDVRGSTNTLVSGVATRNPFTYSIAVVDSTRFCIRGSRTRVTSSGRYDQLDGIHVLNSSRGDVLRNLVDQGLGADGDDGLVAHTMDGGSVHDVRFVGNRVRGGSNGVAMDLATSTPRDRIHDVHIMGNVFYGSPAGIVSEAFGSAGSIATLMIVHNSMHDNGGNAIDLRVGMPRGVAIVDNRTCRSGGMRIRRGHGNRVVRTHRC